MLPQAPPAAVDAFPWWDSRLVRSPAARQLRLGDRAVLFSERDQQLFELNPAAELIWTRLSAAYPPSEVAEELRALGRPAPEAQAFVESTTRAWLETGHLLPSETAARLGAGPSTTTVLRIGDFSCALRLQLAADDPCAADIEESFGQFRAAGDAACTIEVIADQGRYFLFVDETPAGMFTRIQIVPELKALFTDRLSRSVEAGAFLLHAALLARAGKGLLISGAPGAGKTTLALALAVDGWGLSADDVVKASVQGGLTGIRFSPASKSGAWPLLAPKHPVIDGLTTHLRSDGQSVRYVPVGGLADGEADRLAWVLLLERRAGSEVALEPVDPLVALTTLLGAAISADRRLRGEALERLAAQLSGADCRRLVYSDLDAAVAAIGALADG